jgi:hypothetical protein
MRSAIWDHEKAPNYGPGVVVGNPNFKPTLRQMSISPDFTRDRLPILDRGDGWVEVNFYGRQRITQYETTL